MAEGLKTGLFIGAGVVFAGLVGLWVLARLSAASTGMSAGGGRLPPCPASPNCVSSQADPGDAVHYLPPIHFADDPASAWQRLQALMAAQPRVTLRRSGPDALHAEFRSPVFGFVDDVQFLLNPENRVIHFRSASRVGYSDLGANRRRIEAIRRDFSRDRP